MFKNKNFPKLYHLLLIALISFQIFINFFWQKINTAPPSWDSAGHLTLAYIIADKIGYFLKGQLGIVDLLKSSTYYPPLVHFLGALVLLIFGRNYELALLVDTFFFALAIFYLYKIVRYFFNDRPYLALLTAFVFSFLPQVWEQSRSFHLDVPLCALVLASFYYLSRSDSLKNTKHSLLFFLFFSLAQLTKWYGFVFLVVPFIYEVFLKAYKSKDWANKNRIINLVAGTLSVLVLAFPWYVVNLKTIIDNFKVSSTADYGDPRLVLSYESLFHYLELMTSHQVGALTLLLFFVSLYFIFKHKLPFSKYAFWIFLFPYIVFTVIQNKDLRYVLTLTPIISFCVSYWLLSGKKLLAWTKTILFAVYLIGLFFFFSFNQYQKIPDNLSFLAVAMAGPYKDSWIYNPTDYSSNSKVYPVDRLVKSVQQMADSGGISANHFGVLVLSDNKFYSVADFDLFVLQNRFFNMSILTPFYQLNPFTPDQLKAYLSNIQFALIPDIPGPPGLRNIEVLNQLTSYFKSSQNTDFSLIETVDFPDGNKIAVYKRTNLSSYVNPNIREDSLKVSISNILLLGKEKIGGSVIKISLFDPFGQETKLDVVGISGGQERIALEGIQKIVIDLPNDMINPQEIRGWISKDGGVFERDVNYSKGVEDSANEFLYQNLMLLPKSKSLNPFAQSKITVEYLGDKVRIGLNNSLDSVFVAYATTGWRWNTVNLTNDNKELILPIADLVQLEVTQRDQLIKGFPQNWGFFVCYNGNAVCFYPIIKGL